MSAQIIDKTTSKPSVKTVRLTAEQDQEITNLVNLRNILENRANATTSEILREVIDAGLSQVRQRIGGDQADIMAKIKAQLAKEPKNG